MKIIFIRHGEPNYEIDSLTEKGWREAELLSAINATGIGPAALGGGATALAVHLETAPCHIAALPVAVNMGCSAMRSASIELIDWGEGK